VRDIDREALRFKTPLEPFREARLVVYNQESHESVVAHSY
jgi:hypothetical protein